MIIWSSINCPTVICLPTVCYFSREKPLVKSTAPGSLLYHICLWYLFLFPLIFRSINPKTQKYLAAIFIYLFYLAFPRDLFIQSTIILSRQLDNFWHRYPKGIDNPFNTSGCKYLFFVWRYYLRSVAWFSYWFDNLGLITEGNTYRRCVASSLPLWGNSDVASSRIKVPLRYSEWQVPNSIHANSTDTFEDTCRAPLWSPSYVVTFDSMKGIPPVSGSCIIS